jgi:hypothetical protein
MLKRSMNPRVSCVRVVTTRGEIPSKMRRVWYSPVDFYVSTNRQVSRINESSPTLQVRLRGRHEPYIRQLVSHFEL